MGSNLFTGGQRIFIKSSAATGELPKLLLVDGFLFFCSELKCPYSHLTIHVMVTGTLSVSLIQAVTRNTCLFDKPLLVVIATDLQYSCSSASDSSVSPEDNLRSLLRWAFSFICKWILFWSLDLLSDYVRLRSQQLPSLLLKKLPDSLFLEIAIHPQCCKLTLFQSLLFPHLT